VTEITRQRARATPELHPLQCGAARRCQEAWYSTHPAGTLH